MRPMEQAGNRVGLRWAAWLSLGVLAASGLAAGCSARAERVQYLEARSTAIEPGAASGTDRPLAMFAPGFAD